MGTLFRYELKKLLSRKLVWLLFAVCLALMLSQQSYLLEKDTFESARGMKDIYRLYDGRVVTEAFTAEVEKDYAEYIAAHPEHFMLSDPRESGAPYYWSREGYYSGVCRAFENIMNHDTVESRRKEVEYARARLANGATEPGGKLTDGERTYYEMVARTGVAEPVIHYAQGWNELLQSEPSLPAVCTLFLLGLALLPLFCGESSAKMESVLLCAIERRKAAVAKMLAAFGLACVSAVLFFGLSIIFTLIVYGFDGAKRTLAEIEWYGRAALPVGSAFGLFMLAAALAACSAAALVALASAFFRRPAPALLAVGAFIVVQFVLKIAMDGEMVRWFDAWAVRDFIDMLPANLMRNRSIVVFGAIELRYAPYAFGLPALVAALCLWLAPRLFLKRRKA